MNPLFSTVASKAVAMTLDAGMRDKLVIGSIVLGEIVGVDKENNLCKVKTSNPAGEVDNCVWLTQAFTAPILGYRIKSIPSEGTKVVLLYGNPSYILGIIDVPNYDEDFSESLTSNGEFTREKFFKDDLYKGLEASASLLEGEFEIENAFNVGVSFLANIVSLKAGDRAKIEAHLLHDMIRVIAERYESITPVGTISMFNDGRPNIEMNLGSYEHELLNLPSPNQDKVNTSGDHVNFDSLNDNDPVKSFGHRMKNYVGFLGNFLNLFVSDPISNINSIASGKAQVHVGNSGDILLRSVSEIALERVVRVVVPVRLKRSDDITGYMSDRFNKMEDLDILKKWDYGQGTTNNLHQCAYSLRSYARYLSNFSSLIRFHQMSDGNSESGTFKVPAEKDLLPPDMNNKEQDITEANGPVIFEETYSTIRIMRDGSILTMSSDGSTVYQGRGIIELSAAKDIRIEAARDLSIIVGRNTFIKSKKNVEISSAEGGLVLKSRKLFNILCEKGKLWLKSDAVKEGADRSTDYGIVLDATGHDLMVNSYKDTLLKQEDGDILINNSKGSFFADVAKFIGITSRDSSILLKTNTKLGVSAPEIFMDTKKLNVANKLIVTGKEFIVAVKSYIRGALTVRGTIRGPSVEINQYALYKDKNGNLQRADIPGEYNHIKSLAGTLPVNIPSDNIQDLITKEASMKAKNKRAESVFGRGKWSFQKHELDLPDDGSRDALFIPFAQDYIETHEDTFNDYIDWDFEADKLQPAPRTDDSSLPYPGQKVKNECYSDFTAGEVLDKVSQKESSDWDQPEIKTRKIKRKVKP